MSASRSMLKRSLAALVLALPESVGLSSPRLSPRLIGGLHRAGVSALPSTETSSRTQGSPNLSQTRLLATRSAFRAPEPPSSQGINVYRDIGVSDEAAAASSEALSRSSLRNADPDAVFVVNGASRGIGLQFVRTLVDRTRGRIVACCRSPSEASHLQDFLASLDAASRDRIELVRLDLHDQDSIEQAARDIRSNHDRVDLLVNVAGILGDGKNTPGPERSYAKIEREWMETSFQTNVIGPVMFSKELVPLMAQQRRRGKKNQTDDETAKQRAPAVIANLSARVGSISDNGLGGWYSYRMSKAALNQAVRTLSHEVKRQSVWCLSLHPGTTDTDLSKPFQRNVQEGRLFPVEFTVESLMGVIDAMDEEHSGGLYDWAGKAIPF